jgi:hypothetical protein
MVIIHDSTVQRWIVAAVRNRKFFRLQDLNQAIGELLVGLNERPFRKRDGARTSLVQTLEKPALAPLSLSQMGVSLGPSLSVLPSCALGQRKPFLIRFRSAPRQTRFLRPSFYLPALQQGDRLHFDAHRHPRFEAQVSILPRRIAD